MQQKKGNDEIFELNKDVKKRDEITFGNYDRKSYVGGVRRFEGLSLEKLRQLVGLKFIDLEEYHNNSPTVREFIEFMEKYEEYNAIGYTVSIDREDYCIGLDGIEKKEPADSKEEIIKFTKLFEWADEFDTNCKIFAWFD